MPPDNSKFLGLWMYLSSIALRDKCREQASTDLEHRLAAAVKSGFRINILILLLILPFDHSLDSSVFRTVEPSILHLSFF